MSAALVSAALAGAIGAPLVVGHAAHAQEPGEARMQAKSTTAAVDLFGGDPATLAPPPGPAGELAEHPAWRFYHLSFQALASGRRTEAIEQLRHLEKTYKDHPLAARAREILRRLEDGRETMTVGELPAPAPPGEGRDTGPTAFARAELVVAQTIHGVGLGLELCLLASCDDSRAIGAAMVVGGGAGLGLSLLLTSDGITPGHAALLNSGTFWGAATGLFTIGTINPSESRAVPVSMMAGQLAGMGVGHLIWRATHASSADVAVATSGGMWADFVTLMLGFTIANGGPDEPEPMFGALLGSTVLGLGAGALLADAYPMSRSRVLVIDGGGVAGGLVGVGAALIIQSDEAAPYFLLPAIGAVGGLVTTAILTRGWDDDSDAPHVAMGVAPWQGGAMFNASMTW